MRIEVPWPDLASYPAYGLVRPRQDFDEVLARTTGATPESMVALQSDFVSVPAQRILARLRELGVPESTDGLALTFEIVGAVVSMRTTRLLSALAFPALSMARR